MKNIFTFIALTFLSITTIDAQDKSSKKADKQFSKLEFVKAAESYKKLINNYLSISQKGRGRAIKQSIINSDADIVSYMDIDLSTDLDHFKDLVESIYLKGYDISIGSRLSKTSKVIGRKKIREFTSRAYNLLIKIYFPKSKIQDMQCGFKAFSRKKILKVLNYVEIDNVCEDSLVSSLAVTTAL